MFSRDRFWNPVGANIESPEQSQDLKHRHRSLSNQFERLSPQDQKAVLAKIAEMRESLDKNPEATMLFAEGLVKSVLVEAKRRKEEDKKRELEEARQNIISVSGMDPKQFAKALNDFEEIANRHADQIANAENEADQAIANDKLQDNSWDVKIQQSHGKRGRNTNAPHQESHLRNPENVIPVWLGMDDQEFWETYMKGR